MSVTAGGPSAHVTKFYGRLRSIHNVLKVSRFLVLKLTEIVILWVYYTIPFALACFSTFETSLSNFWNYCFSQGSLMRIQYPKCTYILLIKSDNDENIFVKIFFYISTTWWVSLLVDQWVPEGTCNQLMRSTSVYSYSFESIKIFSVEIDRNCNCVGLLHHPFWLQLLLAPLGDHFPPFEPTVFG